MALQTAISEDVEFRKGLPRNYLDHLGTVASDTESSQREKIIEHVKKLVNKLTDHLPVDSCADQFGKKFINDALPPIIKKSEDLCNIFYGLSNETLKNYFICAFDLSSGELSCVPSSFPKRLKKKLRTEWDTNLQVKLIRAYTCR